MSFSTRIRQTESQNFHLAFRPSQVYTTVISAYTIFSVYDGAIEVVTFGGRVTSAAVGGETVATTFNGVAGDAGAVAINGAVGTVVYIVGNVAGATLNAAAIPKTVATLTSMIVGTQPANAPGLIVLTFATGTSWTGEWFMIYRKLSPYSKVI